MIRLPDGNEPRVALAAEIEIPPFADTIVAIVVLYAIGLALFALFGRHRLILSPEEEYAMSGGLHRDPEVEHYGAALEAELPPEDFTEDED